MGKSDSALPLSQPKTAFENSLNDAAGLPNRLNSYKESLKPLNHSPVEEKIQHLNGTLSVIEGLGSGVIRATVPEAEVNKLISSIYQNVKAVSSLISDPTETSKLSLNAAKTEAALKGFILPLSMGGPSDELKNFKLEQSEYKIPMNATKQALLELSNKDIPKSEFNQKVIEKTQEILKKSPENYTSEKLDQFKQFVEQGTQKLKVSKLTPEEQSKVAAAALTSTKSLTESLDKDIQEIKTNPAVQQDATILKSNYLATARAIDVVKHAIGDLEKSGLTIGPELKAKIIQTAPGEVLKTYPAISINDPDSRNKIKDSLKNSIAANIIVEQTITKLEKNEREIPAEVKQRITTHLEHALRTTGHNLGVAGPELSNHLAKELKTNTTIMSKLTGEYNVTTKDLEKIGTGLKTLSLSEDNRNTPGSEIPKERKNSITQDSKPITNEINEVVKKIGQMVQTKTESRRAMFSDSKNNPITPLQARKEQLIKKPQGHQH